MINGARVLLINRNRDESRQLITALRIGGAQVMHSDNAATGIARFLEAQPDFVIVDPDIRKISGWHVIQRVRELGDTPVIVITSHASNEHVSRAFDLNVNGLFVRPFNPADLLSRLDAIQSRGERDEKRWVYRRNGITVDFRSCEVTVDGQRVYLTGTEYRLLTYLIQRRGWVVSHDQILNHVWGSDYLGEKDQVKLYIWYLRRKIEPNPSSPKTIITRRGLGYTFVA